MKIKIHKSKNAEFAYLLFESTDPSKRNCRLIPGGIQTKNAALRYLLPGIWKAIPAI